MEFRNNKNELFDLDGFQYYSSGQCANVYKKNDIVFKIYNDDCKYRLYLSKKVFEILKSIDDNALVKLIDYYYLDSPCILPMDAYSMEFVGGKDVELVSTERKYLEEILEQLEVIIRKLSDKRIIIFDAHHDNILFKENGVTIIDPDQFYYSRFLSNKSIYEKNKERIIEYLLSTIVFEMKQKKISYMLKNPYDKNKTLKKSVLDCYQEDNILHSLIK